MNQDFAMLASPANARRLLILQRVCKIELPPYVHTLARQDALTEADFDPLVCPHNAVKHTIVQFMVDCHLRVVVQPNYHPEINPVSLLYAIKLTRPEHLHIISRRSRVWQNALAAVTLESTTTLTPELDVPDVDPWHTVLIIDVNMGTFRVKLETFTREFPQLVIYDDNKDLALMTHWSHWAELLFPTMPHPLYPCVVRDVPPPWRKQPLATFAPFYNVCLFTHLISDPDIIRHVEDFDVSYRISRHGII